MGRGRGCEGVPVVDVSENNDWTAVRVGLGSATAFGSIYPTYGFIYDRPDTGTMLTAITTPAVQAKLNPAPVDLRPASQRTPTATDTLNAREYDEVAEAPSHPQPAGKLQPASTQKPTTADALNAREYDKVAEASSHPQPAGKLQPASEQKPTTADALNAREYDEVAEAPPAHPASDPLAHPLAHSLADIGGSLVVDRPAPATR